MYIKINAFDVRLEVHIKYLEIEVIAFSVSLNI